MLSRRALALAPSLSPSRSRRTPAGSTRGFLPLQAPRALAALSAASCRPESRSVALTRA